ncbi:MAG: DUF4830 domain-containing protein [Oscillospiraceae bacterium]|nr:DUF4830 domain-containing protein [Oscillospiraceae bacterium]
MVVFTAKLTRRKIVMGILALCVIVCSVVTVVSTPREDGAISVSDEAPLDIVERKVKDNGGRVSLLRECGWEVDEEPTEFLEVRIPEEFDGVYTEYNEIQKRQKLDLSKYCGKRVMRYTYRVKNHPSGEEGIVANLIFYKDKLIGGDVSSPKLGGFMHGLLESSENPAE